MWEKFKMRLGKIVQRALNIFKKKPKYERGLRAKCNFIEDASMIGKEVYLNEGELFIDGESFGKVLKIDKLDLPDSFFEKTDKPAELKCDLTWEDSQIDTSNLVKNLANTYESLLPKLIHVPTLIVSTYASWEYDSVGVDLSLLEEKGIAHYFCTSTKTMEEHMRHFREAHPDAEEWEEQDEGASVIIQDATLMEWPGGYWEWFV